MNEFQQKLTTVSNHFTNGDLHLGFRQLVDCVLDAQQKAFYQICIQHTEWLHDQEPPNELVVERSLEFIEKLKQVNVQSSDRSKALLTAKNLTKTYSGRRFKIENISLEIHPGDVWGLVGENGNGKTTLLRILAQDLSYDTGELTYQLQGTELEKYDLRTKLTYIPQRTSAWYGSLKSNLKFTATHYGVKPDENELLVLMMIIRFGLWKYRNHQWSQLSSGFKMRFELARTFLRSPKILLLDEPLANLDVLAQQLILEDLKSISQSISNPVGIVLSSQQLFEVEKISDKVLFLKNGVPTHLSEANRLKAQSTSVIEFDVEASREELTKALETFINIELSYNGGLYVATIGLPDAMNLLLAAFVRYNIKVKYIRDISHSTRRLFI
ncbi:MAG: ABC transporter ATP-binding protein [Fluviicola sp.]|nr:ABC transporter ATP-binding protein [Fluviicola sp.]